jgi:hypothetical protein
VPCEQERRDAMQKHVKKIQDEGKATAQAYFQSNLQSIEPFIEGKTADLLRAAEVSTSLCF